MKSDPKSDSKAGDKAVTGEPELTKVEVAPVCSSITEQLTIAEMENVTTVFRSRDNITCHCDQEYLSNVNGRLLPTHLKPFIGL